MSHRSEHRATLCLIKSMHGTVEWLPGQPLGNDRKSWSDELIGSLPNIYIYAANNPSGKRKLTHAVIRSVLVSSPFRCMFTESILAKRRGYGTIVSYNVPPYGRAGLYLELATLRELVDEYRSVSAQNGPDKHLCQTVLDAARRCGMLNDVSFPGSPTDLPASCIADGVFDEWIVRLSGHLNMLQERLFSSGLRYVSV
jgi:magnesium chelatase subunit H